MKIAMISVVVTETGTFDAPPELVNAFERAPKTRYGRPDARFAAGREALRLEDEFCHAHRWQA